MNHTTEENPIAKRSLQRLQNLMQHLRPRWEQYTEDLEWELLAAYTKDEGYFGNHVPVGMIAKRLREVADKFREGEQ